VNAQVIILHEFNGRWWVLIQKRSYSCVVMPGYAAAIGGQSDPGEYSDATAMREVIEETGLIKTPVFFDVLPGNSEKCDWFVMVVKPGVMELPSGWSTTNRGKAPRQKRVFKYTHHIPSFQDPRSEILAGSKVGNPCFNPSKQTSKHEVVGWHPYLPKTTPSNAEVPIGHCWIALNELEDAMSKVEQDQSTSNPAIMGGLKDKIRAAFAAVVEKGLTDGTATGLPTGSAATIPVNRFDPGCIQVVAKLAQEDWEPHVCTGVVAPTPVDAQLQHTSSGSCSIRAKHMRSIGDA